jgi:hypothetical protein
MTLKDKREILVGEARKRLATADLVEDYIGHFNEAQMSPHIGEPCPICFRGAHWIRRLVRQAVDGDVENVKCPGCGERYSYSVPA